MKGISDFLNRVHQVTAWHIFVNTLAKINVNQIPDLSITMATKCQSSVVFCLCSSSSWCCTMECSKFFMTLMS